MHHSLRDMLPDLRAHHAREVRFCADVDDAGSIVDAMRSLRDLPRYRDGRSFVLSSTYRRGGTLHEVDLEFQRTPGSDWHVHICIRRMARRRKHNLRHLVAEAPAGALVDISHRVSSDTSARVLRRIGGRLHGSDTSVFMVGEFSFPFETWAPTVDIPAPLMEQTSGAPPVDVLGVRLGWRDGTRNIVVETENHDASAFRVHVRARADLRVSEHWLEQVLGHPREYVTAVAARRGVGSDGAGE